MRGSPAWLRALIGAVLLATAALRGAPPAAAQGRTSLACAKCHSNREFLAGQAGPGRQEALYKPADILRNTVHAGLECADCHRGLGEGYPHRAASKVVDCQTCHAQAGRDWGASIHADNAATKGDAATCVRCHGSHSVYAVKDARSPAYPLNVAELCGRCHSDPRIVATYFTAAAREQARVATLQFPKSVHGLALRRAGLLVAATCSDCHRAHLILPADSAGSSVNRANIPSTCGACHVGVQAVYDSSAHGLHARGRAMANGQRRPECVDCHSAHAIVRADQPQWLLHTVEECGTCHRRVYDTYFQTYHGKVTRLGFGLTAKCSDCHTAHDMRPATDPTSSVHPVNLVATCGQCHEKAGPSYVRYYAHGDYRDRRRYPVLYWSWLVMTTLLVSVWTFWGVHTALWFMRLLIERSRARGRPSAGAGRPDGAPEGPA